MSDALLRTVGDVLVIWTFVASLAFVVSYHITARWWESAFGKSLMIYQIAMTLVLGLTIPRIIIGVDHIAFATLRFIVFAVVPLALTWRISVLIRVQHKSRKDKQP